DKPTTQQKKTKTRGVSALLQGTQSVLMPENTERMARRRLSLLSQSEAEPAKPTRATGPRSRTNGDGCCAGGETSSSELLAARARRTNEKVIALAVAPKKKGQGAAVKGPKRQPVSQTVS